MTATNILSWDAAAKGSLKAIIEVTGSAGPEVYVYEVMKTIGGRSRLLINGEKIGADAEGTGRTEKRQAEAEEHARKVCAEYAPETEAVKMEVVIPSTADTVTEVIGYTITTEELLKHETTDTRPVIQEEGKTFEIKLNPETNMMESYPIIPAGAVDTDARQQEVNEEYAKTSLPATEETRGIPSRDAETFRLTDADPAAEEWERNLDAAEARRVRELSANVETEVIIITPEPPKTVCPITPVDTEVPAVMPVKSPAAVKAPVTPKAPTDGWTRKMPGLPTRTVCGRGAVDAETGRADWWAEVNGVRVTDAVDGATVQRAFKTMKAAKEYVNAEIAKLPATVS